MNPELERVYFSLLSGKYEMSGRPVVHTPRSVLRIYTKFLRRAKFPCQIYFPRHLHTQSDYEDFLREREARYHLARTARHKSPWTMEFEPGCVFWSYRTLEKTQLDLYLLFESQQLVKVILELSLPAARARPLRTHYTLAKQIGLCPCSATEVQPV